MASEQETEIEAGRCLACGRSLSEDDTSGIDWVHGHGDARIYRCACGAHTPLLLTGPEREAHQRVIEHQRQNGYAGARIAEHVADTPVFRCVECRQWVPVPYKSDLTPYGVEGPVCQMCVSYYEYLWGDPDAPEWDEENGYD